MMNIINNKGNSDDNFIGVGCFVLILLFLFIKSISNSDVNNYTVLKEETKEVQIESVTREVLVRYYLKNN